jgi:hypothetical protein
MMGHVTAYNLPSELPTSIVAISGRFRVLLLNARVNPRDKTPPHRSEKVVEAHRSRSNMISF